ncbi:MAG: NUDIX domain-containing protein [Actinomycetota bacterium]
MNGFGEPEAGVQPGDQLVEIVDESGVVERVVTRREMRAGRLRHRSVFVAVLDERNRLLIHRRSPHKDVWPGWCDVAVGGVVALGEDFESAARREVFEEIGLVDVGLEILDGGRLQTYDDDQVSVVGRCFLVHSSGPFRFHDGEVVEAWWSTRREFETSSERFLPDSMALLVPLLTTWT